MKFNGGLGFGGGFQAESGSVECEVEKGVRMRGRGGSRGGGGRLGETKAGLGVLSSGG